MAYCNRCGKDPCECVALDARMTEERAKEDSILSRRLTLLREHGVKHFTGNGFDMSSWRVEFFAPVTAQEPPPTPDALPPATGEERCECACLLSDHEPGGGTCLHGCPAEKCGLPEGE